MDKDILKIVENILSEGMKQGVFRKNLNAKITATYFTALFMGTLDLAYNKAHYLKNSRGVDTKQLIEKTIEFAVKSVK
ncbi:hypothetical protein Dip510_000736 [Elusimicrobium posterum]